MVSMSSTVSEILQALPERLLKPEEVAEHGNEKSCWVIVHGKAYDVTEFLAEHPGGSKIILKYAGKDATAEFNPIHAPDVLDKYLCKSKHLGPVEVTTAIREQLEETPEERDRQMQVAQKPLLSQCYNLADFEGVARRVLKKTQLAYYSCGADDEITYRENHAAYHRIWFRPRILMNVEKVDYSTTMLGSKVDTPFYVSATSLAKIAHPDGEALLTRAARRHNVVQMIPSVSSCSFDEIMDAADGGQPQWFQIFINKDREITKRMVQYAEKRGCKGLIITVDMPQVGRRERDMRSKFTDPGIITDALSVQAVQQAEEAATQGASKPVTSSLIDATLTWADLPWLRTVTTMPIMIKGVQRVEDVLKCVEYGINGVVLSNNGGRQLDFSRSTIEILAEVMPVLRELGLQKRIEIYIDGGIRRGTDIVKALCLGAKGVGIGRPFMFAMATYGLDGAIRAMRLLRDEVETTMRLLGCSSIDQLNRSLVDAKSLGSHGNGTPSDSLVTSMYQPLMAPPQRPLRAKL